MRRFHYEAVSGIGDLVSGEVEAESRADAQSRLRARALDPLKIREGSRSRLAEALNRDIALGPGAALRLRRDFAADLATLRRAGAPLDRALALMGQGRSAGAELARRIANRSMAGMSLSQALAEERRHFDDASVALIVSGEASGNLAEALETLAEITEETIRTRSEVMGSLFYPAALVAASILAIGLMVFHVLPNFERLLSTAAAEPPPLTAALFETGRVLRAGALPGAVALLLAAVVLAGLAATRQGRRAVDRGVLSLPLIGRFIADAELGRACLVAGRLLDAGSTADRSLELAGRTCGNGVFRDGFVRAAEAVRAGRPVAEALAGVPRMPDRAVDMIAIGETAGSLARMLGEVARMQRHAARQGIDALLAALPPVLTVLIGLLVGGLVYAVLSVLLSINEIAF